MDDQAQQRQFVPVPELEEWQRRAEQRQEEQHKALLASRLFCTECDELATVWIVAPDGAIRGDGTNLPCCSVWCHRCSMKGGGLSGEHMVSGYGWLPDGSTWDDPETGAPPGSPQDVMARAGAPFGAVNRLERASSTT